ncbi:unnamed protein product [Acanthoscelides obtectus]|uniref:FAD dependent oxidoreductase domain-containing protein n=1 Tax=Acanthoscelides obtectus TaxID=200917 RepID=A0A9P0PL03_ACAOB|nr:unnamed protein product [Acanthoscelides obtectus]CAK1659363.1 D-aspartate oxidase [Acanthoscelides obtectus]
MKMTKSKIAIIGCGAIGITTALKIQERLKSKVDVTIFSKDFSPNLTSDVAAGLWEPYLLELTPEEKTTRWAGETYQYLIANWNQAEKLGITLQPVTYITDTSTFTTPSWLKITLGYTELPRQQIEQFSKRYNQKLTGGFHFVSFTWEASRFIPYFSELFIDGGGTIVRRDIQDLWELSEYDVVVNCTGLASKDLVCEYVMDHLSEQYSVRKGPESHDNWYERLIRVFHSCLMVTLDLTLTAFKVI